MQTHKPTLLIVDDEAGPRESLRIVFKDRYQCLVATCGREGIEQARRQPVDAAIIDIKMADLSGIEVLREIKAIDGDIECIMLTGYETMETARAAIRLGAADYLNKPFDVFAIRDRVEQCLARRRQKKELIENLKVLKQTNEELAKALAQRERTTTANVLSAGVVHEMNDPLTIIGWYTALLDRDLAALNNLEPSAIQNIQQRQASILREIDRCKAIAQRFLGFSRQTQRADEPAEVSRLIEDAAALIKAHPGNRGLQITYNPGEPDLKIKVHPVEILQVLINLAVNALQAMNGQGTLQLSAERALSVPDPCAFRSDSFDPQRPLVKISVADNGPGMSAELLQRIFTSQFTTKENSAGLGLPIATKLVGLNGGLIDVQSAPGQGTTFSVYLPLAA